MTINCTNSNRDIFTVSRLNREVRELLEGCLPLIWIQGEISNLARPASGHIYFSLKDKNAQVRCALFKNRNIRLRFTPENGMEVLARANVSLYEGRGDYQLIIETLEPAGDGALLRAFEQLKEKLAGEGLFDEEKKQQLPEYPKQIGVITSSTGAALRDILSVLSRRYPLGKIILYPVPVQGEGAANEIARTLSLANERNECDVIILSRGGGSLEDLWAFNEEQVARAIFDCKIPIVSGIGHEIDFTIADFMADKRGATPSAAAELISPDMAHLTNVVLALENQLQKQTQQVILIHKHRIESLASRLRDPRIQLQQISQRLDEYSMRLTHYINLLFTRQNAGLSDLSNRLKNLNPAKTLKQNKEKIVYLKEQLFQSISSHFQKIHDRFNYLTQTLNTVSPLATLNRGYAIVTDIKNNNVIRQADTVTKGEKILIRLAKGKIVSTVNEIKNINDE